MRCNGKSNLTNLQYPLVTKNNVIQFRIRLNKIAALNVIMQQRQLTAIMESLLTGFQSLQRFHCYNKTNEVTFYRLQLTLSALNIFAYRPLPSFVCM
jgi:hypothetical protein